MTRSAAMDRGGSTYQEAGLRRAYTGGDGLSEAHRVLEWLFNDRTTTASRAMAARLAGIEVSNPYDRACHPQDPADFRLCLDVLVRMPEWRDRVPELRSLSPAWASLVGRWNDVAASIERETAAGGEAARRMPLTYALMKELGL